LLNTCRQHMSIYYEVKLAMVLWSQQHG
jgi:hypothetical protein